MTGSSLEMRPSARCPSTTSYAERNTAELGKKSPTLLLSFIPVGAIRESNEMKRIDTSLPCQSRFQHSECWSAGLGVQKCGVQPSAFGPADH